MSPAAVSPAAGGDDELVADYEALRHGTGAFAWARDVLVVRGADAEAYLQGQCSQDVAGLAPGGRPTPWCWRPTGSWWPWCGCSAPPTRSSCSTWPGASAGRSWPASGASPCARRSTSNPSGGPVWPCAVRGAAPGSGPRGPARSPSGWAHGSSRSSWNGTVGVDLLGADPAAAVPPGARWCGPAAWEALRVEAGIPEMGRELDERTIAAEADLLARAVSFTKGCYTGQELVARLDARGNRVARHLVGFVVDPGSGVEARSLVGAALFAGASEKSVGRCTSAARCPGLGAVAALGYLHRSVEVPGEVEVAVGPGGGATRVRAEARPLPLR